MFERRLVINIIWLGIGIYSSLRIVMWGIRSIGGVILLWFFGIVCFLVGIYVYIEYGFNVLCFVIDGVE